MPQLRDSGTRSLHATEPVPSAEMDPGSAIYFRRQGNRIRRGGHRCRTPRGRRPGGDDHVPANIVSRSRSTNTYLTNGSRLYLDVGSHPEYATAEAR